MSAHNLQLSLLLLPLIFWLITRKETFELHLNDTYYIIASFHLFFLLAILILSEAVIYFITRKFKQWKGLQYFHVFSLACFTIILFFTIYRGNEAPKRYYDYSSWYTMDSTPFGWERIILISFLAMALGHLAFVINVIAGFIRGKKAPL